MLTSFLAFIDWFVPDQAKSERSEHNLARVFVFTHIGGPTLAQVICVFLYRSAPDPDFAVWTIIVATWLFWLLPIILKLTRSIHLAGFLSMELLAFASLFGAFHFGGMSSPFLPWLVISIFLGFFYLSDRPFIVVGSFAIQFMVFAGAYTLYGFPERIPVQDLSTVGWVSILSATVYTSWIAIYYNVILSMRSELEREAERHRATAILLQEAKSLAEAANHAKSIFFAKMSHELRTPLNAVIGFSDMLIEDEAAQGDKTRTSDLQKINGAGKHLLSLVTEVLDFSKIESDTWDIAVSKFDLRTFAEEALATIRPLANDRNNKLILNCIGELGSAQASASRS
jgi:signal transduction histidine kinase